MRRALPVALALLLAAPLRAEPWQPRDDAEIVEQLPAGRGSGDERQARRQLAQHPDDAALAVRLARAGLERARASGDPRHAGLALAALRPWNDPRSAPSTVLLLQATLAQHLHDFDSAAGLLEMLLQRQPRDAQAWLTLAVVRRVQGRYADSDRACRGLAQSGAALHAAACAAENDGLRGRFGVARAGLQRLLAVPGLDAATRRWLWTSRAELEQRAGDAPAAERAWREARQGGDDPYAALAEADFLLGQGRAAEARERLDGQPASDAVLLRRAMAGDRPAADELRRRFDQSGLRPDTALTHGRERALFAWQVERNAALAVRLARINLQRQREPLDLQLLHDAGRAAGDAAAVREARTLAAAQGLIDRRWTIDAERNPS